VADTRAIAQSEAHRETSNLVWLGEPLVASRAVARVRRLRALLAAFEDVVRRRLLRTRRRTLAIPAGGLAAMAALQVRFASFAAGGRAGGAAGHYRARASPAPFCFFAHSPTHRPLSSSAQAAAGAAAIAASAAQQTEAEDARLAETLGRGRHAELAEQARRKQADAAEAAAVAVAAAKEAARIAGTNPILGSPVVRQALLPLSRPIVDGGMSANRTPTFVDATGRDAWALRSDAMWVVVAAEAPARRGLAPGRAARTRATAPRTRRISLPPRAHTRKNTRPSFPP
jgi:hypothetical protein